MDGHPLKDEEDTLNYEGFVRGFSECLDQLGMADDLGNETVFSPEMQLLSSTCISEDGPETALCSKESQWSRGAESSSLRSADNNRQQRGREEAFGEGADWTLASPGRRQYGYIGQSEFSSRGSDSSLQTGSSKVGFSVRPVPDSAGRRTSPQKISTLDGPEQAETPGLNGSFREGMSQSFAGTSSNKYHLTMADPKCAHAESSFLELAGPGTSPQSSATLDAPKQDGTHAVRGSNHPRTGSILWSFAAPSRNEYTLTVEDSSVLELAGPGTSPRHETTLDAPKQDETRGSPGSNDSYVKGISPSLAAPSRNEHQFSMPEPKSPPVESSFLQLAGPGTRPQTNATLGAPKQDGTRAAPGSNRPCTDSILRSFAARSRNEYNLTVDDSSVFELAGPGTSPRHETTLDAGKQDETRSCGSNYSYSKAISQSLAASSRSEYLFTAREPKSPPVEPSVLELAAPGISLQNVTRLNVPMRDGNSFVLGLNDSYGEGTACSFVAPSKNECNLTVKEPKSPPGEPSVLEICGPETSPRNVAATSRAPKQDENQGVFDFSNSYGKGSSQSFAAPGRNEYQLTMPEPKSPPFDSSVFELAAPGISPQNDSPPATKKYSVNMRKLDDIGIAQAKQLMKGPSHISSELASSYELYFSKFDVYIASYYAAESHIEGVKSLKQTVQCKILHFSKWTKLFKTKEIPELLAGVSAVWSVLACKDVLCDVLKPHCFQILCILRLLGADQSNGVGNHLAQVMSGEGKSVILALLAATLALTGHSVRVMCYSKYLSSRDRLDFKKLFEVLAIEDQICYGTFEDMANVFLKPIYNGNETSLHDLVKERVRRHSDWTGAVSTESVESVLLIDEVDILFSSQYFGCTYWLDPRVGLRGLDVAQEKMWSLAKSKKYSPILVLNLTEKFIEGAANSGNGALVELKTFLDTPGEFSLFNFEKGGYDEERYSNKSLMREHMLRMAKDAVSVANSSDDDVKSWFGINNEGLICCKHEGRGVYEEIYFSLYKNTFSYFRLKGSGFDSKDFRNYGYLLIKTWGISYARLPSQFPLTLGVSGTLASYEYEKSVIDTYNIRTFSVFPCLSGESKLKFSEKNDFCYVMREPEWLKKICASVKQVVGNFRAVLVIFKSERELQVFRSTYEDEFRRLRVSTENELSAGYRNFCIAEAGLPRTVTLVTRHAGRGVDYQSSVDVENAGGIHVIQTFFSMDIKEENHIKGRTARQGNKGSYELIICKEQLVEDELIYQDEPNIYTYSALDDIRTKLINEKGKQVSANISKDEKGHNATMKFFGFETKPSFKPEDPSSTCSLS